MIRKYTIVQLIILLIAGSVLYFVVKDDYNNVNNGVENSEKIRREIINNCVTSDARWVIEGGNERCVPNKK